MTAAIDQLAARTTFTYDAAGQLKTVTDPLSRTTTLGYDAAGNVTTVTDPLSRTVTYAYDALDRVTSRATALGTSQVSYNGHLLYTFVGDKAPGDAVGQGLGGIWFVLSPAGEKVPA